ncbi:MULTISPECIES: transcriptional regulator domain-containing protein [Paraburkholderia]|uniref:transcriptional regulator domain-containing protein n=1 Tax=Paraburkholderia TaxID=1822464 RepID=UPI001591F9D1|nr:MULTISPECIES: DUF6499 domain-containing protein [Paraburkholderia]NPT38357.1 hypothetical protein [Paraburkholderia xenovorans]
MARSLFPAPSHVFVVPEGFDWKHAADYPAADDIEPQRLAWEFLRRNARYVSGYEALGHLHDAAADSWDRRDANRAREYFCLMWQIAEPVDPQTCWDNLPPAIRIRLIGPPPPQAILPVLGSIIDLDREAGTPTDVSALALQTQLLIRVSVNGDAVDQGKRVTQIIRDLQKRIEIDVPTLDAQGNRIPIPRTASLHDHDAPLRYVRVEEGNFRDDQGGLVDELTHVAYRRIPFRITPAPLHFVLRTLDAIASERRISRSELDHLHVPLTETLPSPPASGSSDGGNLDTHRQAHAYFPSERQSAFELPFGEIGQQWAAPLAQTIAEQFRHDLTTGALDSDIDTGKITPKEVLKWMRLAQYHVLEQGYVQIASSNLHSPRNRDKRR